MDPEDNLKLFTKLYTDDFKDINVLMKDVFMKKKAAKKEIPTETLSSFDIFKQFYETYTNALSISSAKYVASCKDIKEMLNNSNKTFLQIRDYLSGFSTAYLNDVEFYTKLSSDQPSVESVFETIITKYPSIEFVIDESVNGAINGLLRISFKIPITMSYVSIEKNEAWKFSPEIQPISIAFNSGCLAKYVVTKLLHPYMPRNQEVISTPLVTLKRKLDSLYIINIIDDLIKYLSTYNGDYVTTPIDNFIGKKCFICSIRDKDVVINCHESGTSMHKACGKHFGGAFYNPKFIKTCSMCEKESLFWVIKSGNVICEKCNND